MKIRRGMSLLVGLLALPLLMLAFGACKEETATSLQAPSIVAAKGGGGNDYFFTFAPTAAEQGTTLDPLTVTAIPGTDTEFPEGANVEIRLKGKPVATITTNSTTLENPTTLKANISISLEAKARADYEVIVSYRGKRGLGAEKFEVKVHPNPIFEVSFDDQDDESGVDALRSDGGGPYLDGEDEVYANAEGNLIFVASAKARGKGGETRTAYLDFGEAGPIHFDIRTFTDKDRVSAGHFFPEMDVGEELPFGMRFEWKGECPDKPGDCIHRLRFNDAGCGGGVVPEKMEGNEVVVEHPNSNEWRVYVQKGPASPDPASSGGAVYCTAEAGKDRAGSPFPGGPFTFRGDDYLVPFGLTVKKVFVPM